MFAFPLSSLEFAFDTAPLCVHTPSLPLRSPLCLRPTPALSTPSPGRTARASARARHTRSAGPSKNQSLPMSAPAPAQAPLADQENDEPTSIKAMFDQGTKDITVAR